MPACLKCGSDRVIEGRLVSGGENAGAIFQPSGHRWLSFSIYGGVFVEKESFACTDCGLVWSTTSTEELRTFIEKHCEKS